MIKIYEYHYYDYNTKKQDFDTVEVDDDGNKIDNKVDKNKAKQITAKILKDYPDIEWGNYIDYVVKTYKVNKATARASRDMFDKKTRK